MMDQDLKVGTKIKSYLEEKGISQTYVAYKSGISTKKVNDLLNERTKMDVYSLYKISKALECNVTDFL